MADIRPFAALRPAPDKTERVAALPYDVYSIEESRQVVADNPDSFLAIDQPQVNFPADADVSDQEAFAKAGELLRAAIADGTFQQDAAPQYYVYELTMNGRSQTGVVACAAVDDYLNGVIKKHENTRAEKEEGRVRHVRECGAQTGPIFLAYHSDFIISAACAEAKLEDPLFDFTGDDGVRHRGFSLNKPDLVEAVRQAFAAMDSIYIADGHHRNAAAARVAQEMRAENPGDTGDEPFNYYLCVLFGDAELAILDYNRVLNNLGDLSPKEFLEAAKERFDVSVIGPAGDAEAARPAQRGTFSMLLDGTWYKLDVREGGRPDDPVAGLDVSILHDTLLKPVLGIHDPRTDERIDFVGGIRGMAELERRCADDCVCAFAIYPTSIAELFAVADAGLLMPPKSTWFEPKLRSGLFIHKI
jgi:uncharacterized protein (DUF1015 family)